MTTGLANLGTVLDRALAAAAPAPAQESPPGSGLERLRAFYRERLPVRGFDARDPRAFETVARWCARRWDGSVDRGLILHGGTGNGKTSAARAIGALFGSRFISALALPSWYRDEDLPWQERVTPLPGLGDRPRPNRDLIVDEVGDEPTCHHYGMRVEVFAELVMLRYVAFRESGALLILTSNLNEADMTTRYGQRVTSRLAEMCAWVPFTGPDARRARP